MRTTLTTKQILQNTRALIAKKGTWTQRHYARDKLGDPVGFDSHEAVCFCLGGALRRTACGHLTQYGYREVERAILEATPFSGHSLPTWNDAPGRTQREVLALLDRAIKAEGRASVPPKRTE